MDWWQLISGVGWIFVGLGLMDSSRRDKRASERRRRLGQTLGALLVVIGVVGLVVTLATS